MSLLDKIRIASPCSADWNAMPGDARVRSCGDCRKRVYNLSEMTRAEAEALIVAHEGELCLRLYRRRDGTILTADCVRPRSIRRKLQLAGAAAVLAAGCVVDAEPEQDPADEDAQAMEPATASDDLEALFPTRTLEEKEALLGELYTPYLGGVHISLDFTVDPALEAAEAAIAEPAVEDPDEP